MNLVLTRQPSSELATVGEILLAGEVLYTLELSWDGNLPDRSCVPVGDYDLIPYQSPTHGATWRLHNPALNIYGTGFVPEGGRSEIELHAANWSRQLLGCIALGLNDQPMLDPVTGAVEPAVESSRDAVAFLISQLGALTHGHALSIVGGSPISV